ncbi:MAG: type I polyketide synthase [Acidobacteriota bacterium]
MRDTSETDDSLSQLKDALVALRKLRAKLATVEEAKREPIAIIGMGCRFPGGANDPESYWQLLRNGVDAITEFTPDRWDINTLYDPDPDAPGKMYTKWAGLIKDIDKFDADFFGISPREAVSLDPQQRLLLEVSWEALEHAGQLPEKLLDSQTGVFIGIMGNDYIQLQTKYGDPSLADAYYITGTDFSSIAGRLSYFLGLRGPNLVVCAACASSLVTVHLACQSLRTRECDMALAGGVHILLLPETTIQLSRMRAMAADGRCKTFDAAADGYVRGEGCGVVVLKRLSDAISQGDNILAVISGSAINHNGRSGGYTVPNGLAQQEVIRKALNNASVSPAEVSYVEAHGTGTSLGDPIEVRALTATLCAQRSKDQSLIIGSVKTNIGHLEPAAGIASLIKVVLSLQHREIPPNLHYQEGNPHIDWNDLPLNVPTTPIHWPAIAGRRIAGINSFSLMGTNAHVVVEEAPLNNSTTSLPIQISADPKAYLLPLSARSSNALQAMAQSYRELMLAHPIDNGISLADICYNASVKRTHHNHRLTLTASSQDEFIVALEAFLNKEEHNRLSTGRKTRGQQSKIVFIFPGQGSQWFGMGRQLFAQEPVFQEALLRCQQAIGQYVDWSLVDQLMAEPEQSRLNEIDVIQPTLFAIQVALAELWRSWEIVPQAVVGHSMGEVAAAQVAGALSLSEAAKIICLRSRLLKRMSGKGSMAYVELSLADTQQAIANYQTCVSLAVSNSPIASVISGEPTAIQKILDELNCQDIFCRLVKVDVASHSPQMDALRADLLKALAELNPQAGTIPIYSTVTGMISNGADFNTDYWVRNLRQPVLFATAIEQLAADGYNIFLEISPNPILLPAIEQGLDFFNKSGTVLPSLRRNEDERMVMLNSLGSIYTAGYTIDWSKLYPNGGRYVRLPFYPWQRERFWLDHNGSNNGGITRPTLSAKGRKSHPFLGEYLNSSLQPGAHYWETELSLELFPYLKDHCVQGMIVLPAAAYLEMVLAAAREIFGTGPYTIEHVDFHKILLLPDNGTITVQLVISQEAPEKLRFHLSSNRKEGAPKCQTSNWTLHATGLIQLAQSHTSMHSNEVVTLNEIRSRCQQSIQAAQHYQTLQARGLQFGSHFQGVKYLYRREGEALGCLSITAETARESLNYYLHPVLLDACFQILAAALPDPDNGCASTYLPVGLSSLQIYQHPDHNKEFWSHALLQLEAKTDAGLLTGDVCLSDENGLVIAKAEGLRLKCLDYDQYVIDQDIDKLFYQIEWIAQNRDTPVSTNTSKSGYWLLFIDPYGVGELLANLLSAQGEICIKVLPGDRYNKLSADCYQLNSTCAEDFHKLLKDLFAEREIYCRAVVHLWSLTAATPQQLDLSLLDQAEKLGCISMLHTIQALAQTGWDEMPRLWLVTRGALPIGLQYDLSIAQSPICGLTKVIIHEHPELSARLIDLSFTGDPQEVEALFEECWYDGREDQIALRGRERFVARLTRLVLSKNSHSETIKLHSNASYLITGGLGGLGLQVAQWMAEQGAKHLILIGRSAPSRAAQATLTRLQQMGVTLKVMRADISLPEETAKVLAEIEADQPPLRGVVHAAAVLDDGVLINLDAQRFQTVTAAKIAGAWNLHTLTLDKQLDLFVLFSSATSLLGFPGQGNYAAANAFLDSLAYYRRNQGLPALSINWGAWSEVGLVAAQTIRGEQLSLRGFAAIRPEKGLEALALAVSNNFTQVAVMAFNLWQWQQFHPKVSQSLLFSRLSEQQQTVKPQRQEGWLRSELLALPLDTQRRTLLESHIREQVASVLKLAPSRIDLQTVLGDLGFDSLMAIELRNRLSNSLALTLSATLIWRYPTISTIADYLAQRMDIPLDSRAESAPPNQDRRVVVLTKLEQLGEDEAEALLMEKLASINRNKSR